MASRRKPHFPGDEKEKAVFWREGKLEGNWGGGDQDRGRE